MAEQRFITTLRDRLVKEKGVSEITAKNNVNHLRMVAQGGFKNMMFLADKARIEERLATYAPNSRKAILGTIVSVLRLFKSPIYKGLLKHYQALFTAAREAATGDAGPKEVSEKEASSWIDWPEVVARHEQLARDVKPFENQKEWTPAQHEQYLGYAALSLYVLRPPARNSNYQKMTAMKDSAAALERTDGNYYLPKTRQFVFNDYKTAKVYGKQVVPVPVRLAKILDTLLRHSKAGLATRRWKEIPVLTYADGSTLDAQYAMTRLLNSVFGKRIGSNMLRHSYVSHKYGGVAGEMAADAADMNHSVSTQINEYIRVPGAHADVITHAE